MLGRAGTRPFRDRRFARYVIREVAAEAQRRAARERRIEILTAIRRRIAEMTSVARSEVRDEDTIMKRSMLIAEKATLVWPRPQA